MYRLLALGLTMALIGVTTSFLSAAPSEEQKASKEKLRDLSDFIGGWKGTGVTKEAPKPKDPFWSEKVNWGWRFKGDDAWLTVSFEGGKFLKDGEVRWNGKNNTYQLTATPVGGKDKVVFDGKLVKVGENERLKFSRTDPKTKEIQNFDLWVAGEIRLNYRVETKASEKALAKLQFKYDSTKEGESFGKKEKGPECVVSGGRGTTPVTYGGKTYYICCSGCADAFKENPKKYVDEFEAKKKK
jgi:hypothetical protein